MQSLEKTWKSKFEVGITQLEKNHEFWNKNILNECSRQLQIQLQYDQFSNA